MDDQQCWDAKAEEWLAFVGRDGDENRRFNSDPVLWRLLGDVQGLDVLDVGCGTGYLLQRLSDRGARASGIDLSPEMVRIARRETGLSSIAVDDAVSLDTIDDSSFDRVVSNYVLMDVPNHDGALRNMARVLRPGGEAVLVFLHPCFDVPGGPERLPSKLHPEEVRYTWPRPYIDQWEITESWGPFATPFQGYHRPLQDYLGAMLAHGFEICAFEEPVMRLDFPGVDAAVITRNRWAVYSCAWRLRKAAAH